MPTSQSQFTVYLPPKTLERLKKLADMEQRTLSNFVVHHLHRLVLPNLRPALRHRAAAPTRRPKRK